MGLVPLIFNTLALVAVCATAAMHWFGVTSSLYWIYPWWDIPTHVLGGLTVGFWAAAVGARKGLSARAAAFFIVGLGLTVGLGWESWEFVEGLGGTGADTVKDLFDDLFGAAIAWLIYYKFFR